VAAADDGVLALGFVLALPFTGLEPLWGTRRATGILIASSAALILLINTAYRSGDAMCDAILLDLDDDGRPEVLLFGMPAPGGVAFKAGDTGWRELGASYNGNCSGVRDALRSGQFQAVAPLAKDIEVAGQRLRIVNAC
jgi:hypothetical protein